jgi:hypothetical protein
MVNPNYRLHYYTGTSLITDFSAYQAGDIIYEANMGTIVVYEGAEPDPVTDTPNQIYSRYGIGTKAVTPSYDESNRLTKISIDRVGSSSIEIDFSYFITSKDKYENSGVWANVYTAIANQISGQLQQAIPYGSGKGEILITKESGKADASGVTISTTTVDISEETDIHTQVPTVGAVRAALEALNNKFSGTLASVLTFKGIVENYDALKAIQDNNTAVDNSKAKNGDVYRVTTSGKATIYKTWNNTAGWTDGTEVSFGPNTEFFWHIASGELVQNPKGFWDILGTDDTDMTGKYDEVKATEMGSNTYVIPLLVKDGESTAIVAKRGTANVIISTEVDEDPNVIKLTSEKRVESMIKDSENNINSKLIWSTWPTA